MHREQVAIRHWLRYSLGTRARAAFADLGHSAAVLALVVTVTALKFSAFNFALQTFAEGSFTFWHNALAVVSALVIPIPLIVAACNLAPRSGVRRYVWLGVSTALCVFVCVESPLPGLVSAVPLQLYEWRQLAALVVVLVVVFEFRQRALATAGALMRAEIDDVAADARLRDARLRMLQAQLAPHFLFNTLATVRRLAQSDRHEAAAMLGDLAHYFSVTLSRRDDSHATLGDEGRLVDAYLRIHRIRMGARLAYAIDLPEDLARAQLPSMMLLTLVENAVKHGINPLAEGGFVRMRAERRGDALCVEVADNGRGLIASEGHGMGLANIRSRLSTLYGDRANLTLAPGEPRGLVARVSLPLSMEA